ncbi:hypothetical protein VaNZ11_013444, partial [Volvox africanus]
SDPLQILLRAANNTRSIPAIGTIPVLLVNESASRCPQNTTAVMEILSQGRARFVTAPEEGDGYFGDSDSGENVTADGWNAAGYGDLDGLGGAATEIGVNGTAVNGSTANGDLKLGKDGAGGFSAALDKLPSAYVISTE